MPWHISTRLATSVHVTISSTLHTGLPACELADHHSHNIVLLFSSECVWLSELLFINLFLTVLSFMAVESYTQTPECVAHKYNQSIGTKWMMENECQNNSLTYFWFILYIQNLHFFRTQFNLLSLWNIRQFYPIKTISYQPLLNTYCVYSKIILVYIVSQKLLDCYTYFSTLPIRSQRLSKDIFSLFFFFNQP